MNNNEIIKNGVTIAWAAMTIARIGKDQMYAVVEETFRGAHGIKVEVFDMVVTPESIEDDEVLWLCVPTDYKVKNDDGSEQKGSISGREFCEKDHKCPIEFQKGSQEQKRFMEMSNIERLDLMEVLGVADESCEEAFDACFEHLIECSEAYLEECDAEEEKQHFLNKYKCPCGETWEDEWSCACNDRCPSCNKEIVPYESIAL